MQYTLRSANQSELQINVKRITLKNEILHRSSRDLAILQLVQFSLYREFELIMLVQITFGYGQC
jgi:hypothetical protein